MDESFSYQVIAGMKSVDAAQGSRLKGDVVD
jgi:hypothetical protein